ncbi:MAG: oxygen-independent coproporphyrinogen III oxidase [Nevskiaceae bacterium]|nr:MAG: oxygen-independent coproporphyrinogen III oxidase [Nevskiaceae bacterium]
MSLVLNAELQDLLESRGPRYTSYPTALMFNTGFGAADFERALQARDAQAPLSLYVHIPYCRSLCYYCACTKIVTRNDARIARYLNALLQEIEWLGRHLGGSRRLQQLHFGGGSPSGLAPEQLGVIMEALHEVVDFEPDEAIAAAIEVDPRTVGGAELRVYRALGFNRISFGVQDFDQQVQSAVNRVQSALHVQRLIESARTLGYRGINADLIYGLPHQTVESFSRTVDTLAAMMPDRIAVYSYAHLPDVFKAQRLIDAHALPTGSRKVELFLAAQERLAAVGYQHIGMDHFSRPGDELAQALADGSLQRNFQGYSTHAGCDIVGLGMSAISQVGAVYAQNVKSDRDYEALVAQGPATERGLQLTPGDLIRRDLIQKLMCRTELDLVAFSAEHGIDFGAYFAHEHGALLRLQALGLLQLSDTRLAITPLGRYFLRPICAVFDAHRAPGATQRYSQAA